MFSFNPLNIRAMMMADGNDETLKNRVIATAKSLIGQQETAGNSGFKEPLFQKRMEDVGWNKGQAWCSYAAELIWKDAFGKGHRLFNVLERCFSGMAVKTFENFAASTDFSHGQDPKPGALVIWKHGKGPQGHAGIVVSVLPNNEFKSVEGNTNQSGGREGIEIALKLRKCNEPFHAAGLNLEGFIYLPE